MSLRYLVAAFAARVGHPGRKLVLLKLSDNANDEGVCWPSKNRVAQETELSTSSVKRYLVDLEADGWIKIEHRLKDGVNLPSRYELVGLSNLIEGWGRTDPTGVKMNAGVGSHRPHPVHTDPGGGVCVTPEPPSKPSTPPPPLETTFSNGGGGDLEKNWLEAANLEIEIALTLPRGVRNVAGLRKKILQRYAQQNGPDREVLAELTRRRVAVEAAATAEAARQALLEAPPVVDQAARARGVQVLANLRARRQHRETQEETT